MSVEDQIAGLLAALGVADDPETAGTPARVAALWRENLLSGYAIDPAAALADPLDDPYGARVQVTGLPFHTVCPHHLTPSFGTVDLAYQPAGRIVGFGALERLVHALSRRLVLQEALTAQIADALIEHLGAAGAACRISATHLCLSLRGNEPHGARVVTHVRRGCLIDASDLFEGPA